VGPADVGRWQEIPALPAEAFKEGLTSPAPKAAGVNSRATGAATNDATGAAANDGHAKENERVVFLSSGTTAGAGRRSRHELDSLDTYRLSAMGHFRRMVMADKPGPMATLLLGPSATTHPHSSLGRMFTWCVEDFSCDPSPVVFDADGSLDVDAAVAWLREREADGAPVLLLALSSALSELVAELRQRRLFIRLGAASRLVDTGGRKGATKVLSAKGLLKATWDRLHIPPYMAVNEYGMTEMLSQFYDDALLGRVEGRIGPRVKLGPRWVRSSVVDPASLEPVAPGRPGLLRHFDLANCRSVSALQTFDLGRSLGRGFELLGRASTAEARGCSQLMAAVEGTR
jgi:hypothetical protein